MVGVRAICQGNRADCLESTPRGPLEFQCLGGIERYQKG